MLAKHPPSVFAHFLAWPTILDIYSHGLLRGGYLKKERKKEKRKKGRGKRKMKESEKKKGKGKKNCLEKLDKEEKPSS